MAETTWQDKLAFGSTRKKDSKEPKRGDFPKGSTGQAQYNLAWAKWDRTSGNTAVRQRTAKLQELNTDVSRARENLSRFDTALAPSNIEKLSLMRRNQVRGYRDAAEANLIDARSKLSAADPGNFGLYTDAANPRSLPGGVLSDGDTRYNITPEGYAQMNAGFDGKIGHNLQGLSINFDYNNAIPGAISNKQAYSARESTLGDAKDFNEIDTAVTEGSGEGASATGGGKKQESDTTIVEPTEKAPETKKQKWAGNEKDGYTIPKPTSIQKDLLKVGFTEDSLARLMIDHEKNYGKRGNPIKAIKKLIKKGK